MAGSKIAFIIWAILAGFIIVMGIYVFFSQKQKAFGFFANAKTLDMEDVRGHNRALGKLWIVFGSILILLGLPLLDGQNSPLIVLSILGVLIESIAAMAVYILKIENKYKKK